MALFKRLSQDALRVRAVEEIILRRPAREHERIIEHVQIRCAARRVLGGSGIDVDDPLLSLLNATQLAANLVVSDELDKDFTICA